MASHTHIPNEKAISPALARRVDRSGIVACLFTAGTVLVLAWFKVGSLDIGYHVAYGRHFLQTGEIVGARPDPSLYPETAIPFVNANWGSQVIMALAERAGGAAGLFALRIALIGIIFACIAAVVRKTVSSWFAVAAAWLLAALPAYERFSMRPELFSYAILSLQLVILTRGLRSWKSVFALAALQLAWVNLHSYFLVGPALSVLWLIDRAIARQSVEMKRCVLILIFQVGVCVVNPWHLRGLTFPIETLNFLKTGEAMGGAAGDVAKSAWSAISEFQSPFSFIGELICARTITAYLNLLGFACLGTVSLMIRRRWAGGAVILVLFLMSTQMRRNIAQFAIVAAPLSVAGVALIIPWSKIRPGIMRGLRAGGAALVVVVSGWIIITVADGSFYYHERRISREFGTGFSDRTFPHDAVRWIADHDGLRPNLYVDYFSSSNTLPWLPERFRLFVNTNTFAYEDGTLATAFKLGLAKIRHASFLDEHAVNVVLLHCGPDTQLLVRNLARDDGNWALVYFDPYHVIFIRRIVPHIDVIRHNRLTPASLDATQWISKLDEPDRTKALALGTMINVPLSLSWWEPATKLAEEAVRLAPDYDEAWHYLGVAEVNFGKAAARAGDYDVAAERWRKGIQCFEHVVAIRPGHAEAKRYRDETKEILEMVNHP